MEKNMYEPGPLYSRRHELTEMLKNIPLKTGDIVFSASDVAGPFGIPFSKLIQTFTKSKYSHATTILVESEDVYAIDVSDHGTRKLRLIDWFDDWYMDDFCVFRLRHPTKDHEENIKKNVYKFLELDPHYDFNFVDDKAFYCTEAVSYIYKESGINLGGAYTIKQILPTWFYYIVVIGSYITKIFTNSSLPSNVPITIVGNDKKGMLASPYIYEIFRYDGKLDMYFC